MIHDKLHSEILLNALELWTHKGAKFFNSFSPSYKIIILDNLTFLKFYFLSLVAKT